MRKIAPVLTFMSFICFSAAAFAQVHGSIDPAGDAEGTTCILPSSGFNQVFIVARPNLAAPDAGFFAVEFNVDMAPLFAAGASPAGETNKGNVLSGSIGSGTGVQVGFDACQDAPAVWVYGIGYFALDPIVGPVYVSVIESNFPDPAVPTLGFAICDVPHSPAEALGGQGVVDGFCTISTKETTWGKLKSLYNN